tara:strand:- start:1379 stop:1843 length:465 start_codon:yes stop_codon:yes gene_type:complete
MENEARRYNMNHFGRLILMGVILLGIGACSSSPKPSPLSAPAEAIPAAASHNQDGLQLFADGKIDLAGNAFKAALTEDPDMAEAHYNLALTLFSSGYRDEAEQHFLEAANLAPGHKIIWDSPALRPYGSPRLLPKDEDLSGAAGEMPNALDNMF